MGVKIEIELPQTGEELVKGAVLKLLNTPSLMKEHDGHPLIKIELLTVTVQLDVHLHYSAFAGQNMLVLRTRNKCLFVKYSRVTPKLLAKVNAFFADPSVRVEIFGTWYKNLK